MTPIFGGAGNCRSRDVALALLLFALTFAAYFPALHGEFLLDDDVHVTRPELRTVAGLGRIWFELGATQQYYPVLHTAFWLEHRLWGDAVVGYHLANILLHACAALLVVRLARELRLAGGWLAGFVFALHPVCAESVAWIAEQKNTLSTVLALAAAILFLRWRTRCAGDDAKPGARSAACLAGAGLLFLMALLSKTPTAPLPAALLVIAWWQRGALDWRRDVRPLLPWFLAAAVVSVITLRVERELISGIHANLSFGAVERAMIASRALWFYLLHLLWPANLSFFYERWEPSGGWPAVFTLATLAVGGALLWLARTRRGPLAALLLFAGLLFPVLGFLDVEWFVFAFVADHFQYFASIPIILAACSVVRCRTVGIAVAGALAMSTWGYSRVFRSNIDLYAHAVAQSPRSAVAHHHYGAALAKVPARRSEAAAQFEAALRINSDAAEVHEYLGELLWQNPEHRTEALAHLDAALRIKPELERAQHTLAAAHFDRGKALATDPGRLQQAIAEYEAALQIAPSFVEAHYNLGNVLMKMPGREDEAMAHFEKALRLKPDFAEAHSNLGALLARQPGKLAEAIAHFEAALRADPNFLPARNNLERARAMNGNPAASPR